MSTVTVSPSAVKPPPVSPHAAGNDAAADRFIVNTVLGMSSGDLLEMVGQLDRPGDGPHSAYLDWLLGLVCGELEARGVVRSDEEEEGERWDGLS